jgi:hypothetical protein
MVASSLPLNNINIHTTPEIRIFYGWSVFFNDTVLQEIATGGSNTTLDFRSIGVIAERTSVQYSATTNRRESKITGLHDLSLLHCFPFRFHNFQIHNS